MSLCSSQTRQFADEILAAYDGRRQIGPLTGLEPTFSAEDAQKVSHEITRRRTARGETVIGRKIGFTNRTIWDEYGVYSPIWGPVYDKTYTAVTGPAEAPLSRLVEPRIEPEIVFGFKAGVTSDMDERAILGAIGWVAHGFEIVQSLYPGWRFQAADCIAAFGLHGALYCGPQLPVGGDPEPWLDALTGFSITLSKDGVVADRGVAANVLGGPLSAIRHLAGVLAEDAQAMPIGAGEIITTGTVTRALPVAPGELWTTVVEGLAVQPMSLRFV
ncbi:2-keto-4-pentenoate hydratase [Phreatobacter stygius]|uniref:Hydratase n=1 Tax=Phreatobacter stygius TaxID=1940610 RepID=A0A4D7AXD8_9HYPH|nr:hydratase [Phreatobacter stygius]QCI64771.1 hydratase [Phreatobacter stygius]